MRKRLIYLLLAAALTLIPACSGSITPPATDSPATVNEIKVSTRLVANTVIAVTGGAAIMVSDDAQISGMHDYTDIIAIELDSGREIFNVNAGYPQFSVVVSDEDFENEDLVWICIYQGYDPLIQCMSVQTGEILWSYSAEKENESYYSGLYHLNGQIVFATDIRARFFDPINGDLLKEIEYDEDIYLAEGLRPIVERVNPSEYSSDNGWYQF